MRWPRSRRLRGRGEFSDRFLLSAARRVAGQRKNAACREDPPGTPRLSCWSVSVLGRRLVLVATAEPAGQEVEDVVDGQGPAVDVRGLVVVEPRGEEVEDVGDGQPVAVEVAGAGRDDVQEALARRR